MKKKKIVTVQKNSKPVAEQTVTVVQITEDTTCIVNFNLAGAFKNRQSNAGTKEEIHKMKSSPILDENRKGRFICTSYNTPGRKLRPNEPLPKSFFVGSRGYKPCTFHKCTLRRVYNSESLLYLSSIEACPSNIRRKQWENMTVYERLISQFTSEANSMNFINPGFTFEFVN